MTLVVCVVVIVLLNICQKRMAEEAGTTTKNGKVVPNETTGTKIVGGLIGVLVQVMNFILTSILKWTSGWEAYSTRTLYNSSIALKSTIALFFNTALINFTINIVYLYHFKGAEYAS